MFLQTDGNTYRSQNAQNTSLSEILHDNWRHPPDSPTVNTPHLSTACLATSITNEHIRSATFFSSTQTYFSNSAIVPRIFIMIGWIFVHKTDVTRAFFANVNVLRYVYYMLSAVRLSSVCLSSVTLVHPTQAVELFGNFFHHTIAQGLYFSGAKNRWWGTPLSP